MTSSDRKDSGRNELHQRAEGIFSSFMFQKEAERLWQAMKNSVKNTGERITWEFLVNKFIEKYIPETARDKMASDF